RRGVSDPHVVARDATTDGPVLVITVEGKNASPATTELASIVAQVPRTVRSLQTQESVKEIFQFRVQSLPSSNHASPVRKSQIRAVLVALVAGSFLSTLA